MRALRTPRPFITENILSISAIRTITGKTLSYKFVKRDVAYCESTTVSALTPTVNGRPARFINNLSSILYLADIREQDYRYS
jgi:hypothetical protein